MKCDRTWAKGRSWFDLRLYETLGVWIYSANSSNRPPIWPLSQMCQGPQSIMGNCKWNRPSWLCDGVALDSTACEIEFRDGALKGTILLISYQTWWVCETTVKKNNIFLAIHLEFILYKTINYCEKWVTQDCQIVGYVIVTPCYMDCIYSALKE